MGYLCGGGSRVAVFDDQRLLQMVGVPYMAALTVYQYMRFVWVPSSVQPLQQRALSMTWVSRTHPHSVMYISVLLAPDP